METPFDVIYEDADTLVINKPAGIVVHRDGRTEEETLVSLVTKFYPALAAVGGTIELIDKSLEPRAGIVHRLDRETSGALLIAKNQKAFDFYQKQFIDREISKTYHGIVIGRFEKEGDIDLAIGRGRADFRVWETGDAARGTMRDAVTHYRALESTDSFSLVEFTPKTGRTHQIRVHAKALGFPLVGDSLYGPTKENILDMDRVALHAMTLGFTNTASKRIVARAPYPPDFTKALEMMRDLAKKP